MSSSNINNLKEISRCPDCGRMRPKTKDLCPCGFLFPPHPDYSKRTFKKWCYSFFWRNKFRRKNTISFLIVLLGALIIGFGYYTENLPTHKMGVPDYFKVRDEYTGTDKYYLSSDDEKSEAADIYKMVGAAVLGLGVISILSKWLIRPMNANSAKHDKYQWR